MKLSFLIGGAVGYVLGSKAGRERYEQIVSLGRRVGGSQTVQSTAGVLQGQIDVATQRARQLLGSRIAGGGQHSASTTSSTANGSGY